MTVTVAVAALPRRRRRRIRHLGRDRQRYGWSRRYRCTKLVIRIIHYDNSTLTIFIYSNIYLVIVQK